MPENVKIIRNLENYREKGTQIKEKGFSPTSILLKKLKNKNFLWELKNQSKAGFLPPPFNFQFS
jgi:hypothetical protein